MMQNLNAKMHLPRSLQVNVNNETKRMTTNKKGVVRSLMKLIPSITRITTFNEQPVRNIALTAKKVREHIAGFTLGAHVYMFVCSVLFAWLPIWIRKKNEILPLQRAMCCARKTRSAVRVTKS